MESRTQDFRRRAGRNGKVSNWFLNTRKFVGISNCAIYLILSRYHVIGVIYWNDDGGGGGCSAWLQLNVHHVYSGWYGSIEWPWWELMKVDCGYLFSESAAAVGGLLTFLRLSSYVGVGQCRMNEFMFVPRFFSVLFLRFFGQHRSLLINLKTNWKGSQMGSSSRYECGD